MMTTDELRVHFVYLVGAYVTDPATNARLWILVAQDDIPAKGILAGLTPCLSVVITDTDAKIIKDIAFNFC